ncbi:hypothetical protein GCM10022232_65010 [Streptomyces plumbiresistens]|uniref:Uncharacterized protein n=1 Tax=Streptomyces plumbiresistens TaxID=511811 RepID=A0ABP7SMH9_9ACTN
MNCMRHRDPLSEPFIGDAIHFEEPLGVTAPSGNTYAATQRQTISNGGFWHPSTPTESLMSKDAIPSPLADLEPKYTSFILNCPPNRDGLLDTNIVSRLAEVGAAWSPDTSRPPLPTQQLRAERPVTPVNACATDYHTGEGPLNAVDGLSDNRYETCWSNWGLSLPQSLTIGLGGVWSDVSTLEYVPKPWSRTDSTNGDITSYTILTSTSRKSAERRWPSRMPLPVSIDAASMTASTLDASGFSETSIRPPKSLNRPCTLVSPRCWASALTLECAGSMVHGPGGGSSMPPGAGQHQRAEVGAARGRHNGGGRGRGVADGGDDHGVRAGREGVGRHEPLRRSLLARRLLPHYVGDGQHGVGDGPAVLGADPGP